MSLRWRIPCFLAGVLLGGTSVALLLRAGLGVSSYDVLNSGLAGTAGIPVGTASWIVSAVVLGLAVLLDAVGPFRIWYLVVLIIGAARLGGVSRRNAAWTLGTLYVLIALIGAVVASAFAPAG